MKFKNYTHFNLKQRFDISIRHQMIIIMLQNDLYHFMKF